MPKRKTVGLALGGGAARGVAHIGVLKVLIREQIPIDFVAGTSSGALIAACYAAGISLESIAKIASQTNWRALVAFAFPKTSLLSSARLSDFLQSLFAHRHFSDLEIPLTVVTADLYSGAEYLVTEGEVEIAVRASCSVPGLFPPVPFQGKLLVDGGTVNNVPVNVVRQMGADIVLGVDVNEYEGVLHFSAGELQNIVAILYRSQTILLQHNVRKILREADIVIRPPTAQFPLWDLKRSSEMIALGEAATAAIIPQVRELLSVTDDTSTGCH